MAAIQYRINRLNDVHARWALTAGLKGGLCKRGFVPNATSDSWYDTCIDYSTGGTVRAVEAVLRLNEEECKTADLDASVNCPPYPVVHVFTGDEFQGTPLFTFDDGSDISDISQDTGWASRNMLDYMKMTSLNRAPWHLDVFNMVPGNHEFDAGLPALETYINTTTLKGLNWTCANCNWGEADCMTSATIPVHQRYKVKHPTLGGIRFGEIRKAKDADKPKTPGYTMLTIFGMTVPAIHNQAKVPAACEMIEWTDERFKNRLVDALAVSDELWISSHMGIGDDILFAKWLRDESGIDNLGKIKGLTGGHSHSVPCGNSDSWDINPLSNNPSTVFIEQINSTDMEYNEIVKVGTTTGANCYKISGGDCCTLTAEGQVPVLDSGIADPAQCTACDTTGLELHNNNFYPSYPTNQYGLDIYHSGNHGALMAATLVGTDGTTKTEYLLPLDAALVPREDLRQMHMHTFTDALPLLVAANNDVRMNAPPEGFNRLSCKGKVDETSGNGVAWPDTNNKLAMSCALGHGMASAYVNATFAEAKELNMSAAGDQDGSALLARLDANEGILKERVVSIYNGGGIRGTMPDGEVTFYDMINVAPFWDMMAVTATSGEQLIANLNHGALGQQGIQMAGIRALVAHDWNFDTLNGQLSAIAAENSLDMKKLFCDTTVSRKADHAARREDDYDFFIRTAQSEAMKPTVYAPTPAAKEAAEAVTASGLVWQSNSCLGPELFAVNHQKIFDGEEELPNSHAMVYLDECWVDIIPTETYLVSTVQFLLGGGDHYCLPMDDVYVQVELTSFAVNADGQTSYLVQYTNTIDKSWEKFKTELVLMRAETPTDEPTNEPTDKPTNGPTDKPTNGPTDKPTNGPTDKPTHPPTDEPTDPPPFSTWPTEPTDPHTTSSAEGTFTFCLFALLSAIL